MKNFDRGAGIHIAVTFRDKFGNIVTPDGANLTLSYVPVHTDPPCPVFVTYALVSTAEDALDTSEVDWAYDWDSSVSAACVVNCTAYTTTANTAVSKVDFSFRLVANRANKQLAGDDSSGTGY